MADLCSLCLRLLSSELADGDCTLNAGGPERLSRADMGDAVAAARGYPPERVLRVAAASVVRTPASPLDISMDMSRTVAVLGVQPRPFAQALQEMWCAGA